MNIRKILDKVWLWVAHRFGTEKQMMPSLLYVDYKDVRPGRLYEWYGRIVRAVRNPEKVTTTYTIYPSKNMSQRAVELICCNADHLNFCDTHYATTHEPLGEALKQEAGVSVTEETEGKPCEKCCMLVLGLPCPGCDFSVYWEKVAEYKQHCTDQEAWGRAMQRRIER